MFVNRRTIPVHSRRQKGFAMAKKRKDRAEKYISKRSADSPAKSFPHEPKEWGYYLEAARRCGLLSVNNNPFDVGTADKTDCSYEPRIFIEMVTWDENGRPELHGVSTTDPCLLGDLLEHPAIGADRRLIDELNELKKG